MIISFVVAHVKGVFKMSIKTLRAFIKELREQGTKVEELKLKNVSESLKLYDSLKI